MVLRYGDIAILYNLLQQYGIVDTLNQSIPRRGLPAGEILASLALNHIIDRETLNLLSKWYQDTALEDFTKIPSGKLNSTNLGAVMGTIKKLVPEGMVDVCIKLFDQIKHLENGSASLLYDITSTYFYTTKLPKARHGHNRDENNQPQINISLVATKDKGLPIFFRTYEGNITDVTTVKQMILDVKRIDFEIDDLILDRGMASITNLQSLAETQNKIIGGIPLTSNEAKELVECDISEENELLRPSGLVYYEDKTTTLFGINGRAIICFNHTDLEQARSLRLKKITVAEKKIAEILTSPGCDEKSSCIENEIKSAIKGVSNYFIVKKVDGKIQVSPDEDNRRKAKSRDGKCLIFTTDLNKSAPDIISLYFGKDVIEKIFNCFKNWLDLQPVRHFDEGHIDLLCLMNPYYFPSLNPSTICISSGVRS
ncbi:MAG: IS1634 family transposase [Methanosarcinales archaeon]|nr:IS1634 family transposase [Methanosarcinales archaeon]